MQEEEWRPVADFEGYCVSNLGRVRSDRGDGRIMKLNDCGMYPHVRLSKNKKATTHKVHRLVAEAFIPNPDGKRCVDHIDRNKQNNVVSNLRWATHAENNFNTNVRGDNISGFKGVSKSRGNRWYAFTSEGGKTIYLGSFATKEEAAGCYRLYHGE
jgi:hypothetical protein